MGNCCLKKIPIQDPNEPFTLVHTSPNGTVKVRVSHQFSNSTEIISKTRKTHRKGLHGSRSSPHSSPKAKGGKRRPPTQLKNLDVPCNTRIGGNGSRINKKSSKLDIANEPCCFGYKVLRDATNNFNKKNLIGVGGFADVFKGHITYVTNEAAKSNEGYSIAVKRLDPRGSGAYECWKTEVDILSKLNHPNIVQLVGFCKEGEHRMIVYEYMAQGSLDCRLFKDDVLNWRRRINIAIGAAKGLAYLHRYGKTIIHRDIKASNVLLDSKYNAKISDFGLAKHGPKDENDHITTKVIGTQGYFAPEYYKSGHLTMKADVYSFGVVLLEILTGTCVDKKCPKGVAGDLVQRSKPFLSRHTDCDLRQIIDARLKRNIPMGEAQRFAEVTSRCLNEDPKKRPTMNEVVGVLENLQPAAHDHPRVGRFRRDSLRMNELKY